MVSSKPLIAWALRNAIAFLMAGILLHSLSCKSPFATREPESPKSNQSSWIQPTAPNYVMTNLRNAIAEKNITNYLRCLADTSYSPRPFRFIPEPTVANVNPGLFNNWSNDAEKNYLNQLMLYLPKDSTSQLILSALREDALSPDSTIMVQSYRLIIEYKCEAGDCPRIMVGQSEFRLIRTSEDLWYIYRWSDIATGEEATWSALRARFGK
jgi:hypothetical protein